MDTAYTPMLAVDRQVDLVREVHAAAASIAVKDGAPSVTGNEGPRTGTAYNIPAEMMVRGSDVPEVAMHGSLNKAKSGDCSTVMDISASMIATEYDARIQQNGSSPTSCCSYCQPCFQVRTLQAWWL
jgi:hypothetical protein